MTKKLGNIYEKLCDRDFLLNVHKECRQGKTHRPEVREVDENLD